MQTICLIGKGIVFDTGGLTLKSRDGMCGMKVDCGGAAAIMSAFSVIASTGTSTREIIAVLCVAENAVGPNALRPDDIITLYSGKTVEINNPDAEGRLVVADGVAYAMKNFNPQVVIDMCTLTGAQSSVTGRTVGAILCNSALLEDVIVKAGKISGDVVFPVIYIPEYCLQEYTSRVADMKNSAKDRGNATVSTAGLFIDSHMTTSSTSTTTNQDGADGLNTPTPWAHIDMCAPAMSQERATGYGVSLLLETIASLEGKLYVEL